MKRRLVAVTLSLIMTMATVSEAGAAAFTSPDTAPAVATQTDAEEVNVTEETSETGTSETEATLFKKLEMMGQQYHHRNRQTTHLQRERIRLLHCRTRRRQQQMLRMPLEPL